VNGTHQFLVYAHNINLLGVNIDIIKKNTEALLNASKEAGLEVMSTKKIRYMFMFCCQSAGQNDCRKLSNKLFENVGKFKYLDTAAAINSIYKELRGRLNLRNAFYHAIHNLSCSCLPFKPAKNKICKSIILHVIL
jgi:hypothetical protein